MSADCNILLREHGRPARDVKTITGGTPVLPVKSTCPHHSTPDPRHLGAALPFVLILLALNVIVIVAMLAYATTEYQASRNSVQAESARALAQSGIDLAAGLISANSTNNAFVTYQRVTNIGSAWRLETKIANIVSTNRPWQTKANNPAVLHSGFATGTDGFDLNFAVDPGGTAGFIAPRTNLTGWTNLSPNMFLMDWIYVYKGPTNDPANLIGRIAYWVDDESSKLNVNYSGDRKAYPKEDEPYSDYGKWTDFSITRTNPQYPGMPAQKNFEGRKWPVFMELGGVAGLSLSNALDILNARGTPKSAAFAPFPSVLALRLPTINSQSGPAITTIQKQAELGFTATIYSKEPERSYASGKKRFDLLKLYPQAPMTSTISDFQNAIVAEYPSFANKYDLPGFASAAYSLVQQPDFQTGRSFGSSQLYSRGLPVINEVSLQASINNSTNATNIIEVTTEIEMIVLGATSDADRRFSWGPWINDASNATMYNAYLRLSTNTSFGLPLTNMTVTGSTNTWFLGKASEGPTNTNFSGIITRLSSTITHSNIASPQWSFPTSITIEMRRGTDTYQTISFIPDAIPADSSYAPVSGDTNSKVVYHLVALPKGDTNSYRGDPRFGIFTNSVVSDPSANLTNAQYSIGFLNTNASAPFWNPESYRTATNQPDLIPGHLFFTTDRGLISQYVEDKQSGFGPSFAGIGWVGEVPVTTSGSPVLAWSTPRLWGNGRAFINDVEYPPDWLMLDCFHMAAWNAEADPAESANLVFSSYGRVNLNTAKSFFQVPAGSTNRSDTIIDSITVNSKTLDFRRHSNNSFVSLLYAPPPPVANNSRTNFLSSFQLMTAARNSTNNPYTTHFEFLADLAVTNMPNNPNWTMAPNTNTGNIYTATNTTDRRIEGIVRSLVQKLTTHGNQFTIFSLGQALKVSPSGQTNVVGEAYLQAVYERAPQYDETTGAITNGSTGGAPPMRQLFLRELR